MSKLSEEGQQIENLLEQMNESFCQTKGIPVTHFQSLPVEEKLAWYKVFELSSNFTKDLIKKELSFRNAQEQLKRKNASCRSKEDKESKKETEEVTNNIIQVPFPKKIITPN